MKKVFTGLIVAVAVAFVSLGLAVPAQAYPDAPPTENSVTPGSTEAAAAQTGASLPDTGGPNGVFLGAGLALVVAGGVVLLSARPRQRVSD